MVELASHISATQDSNHGKLLQGVCAMWSLLQGNRQIHACSMEDLVSPLFPEKTG